MILVDETLLSEYLMFKTEHVLSISWRTEWAGLIDEWSPMR